MCCLILVKEVVAGSGFCFKMESRTNVAKRDKLLVKNDIICYARVKKKSMWSCAIISNISRLCYTDL